MPARTNQEVELQIRHMTDADIEPTIALWQRCGLTRPWNDPRQDIAFCRSGPASAALVAEEEGQVVAALLVGHDGHRGTVYYVGTDPDRRGHGLGRAIMAAAEEWLRRRGVWKLNLLVREGNDAAIGFYEALGYGDQQCVALGKRLDGRPDRA